VLNAFSNIFKIAELKRKVLITIGLLMVYRIGTFLPLPFIDLNQLGAVFGGEGEVGGTFVDFVNMFSGGAFRQMSVMALGIMPYISASIILQLLTVVIPALEKLSKEGEEGRKKITQYTRIGTVILCVFQSLGLGIWMLNQEVQVVTIDNRAFFLFITMITMTAGTTFLMWLGEKISEYGIGNGISLIIMAGIVAGFPLAIVELYEKAFVHQEIGVFGVIFIFLGMFGVIFVITLMTQSMRKVPVQHAKKVVGRRVYSSQATYLPIRLTTAGVIPIIFASSILMFPHTLGGLIGGDDPGSLFARLGHVFQPGSMYNLHSFIAGILNWISGHVPALEFTVTIWNAAVFRVLRGFDLYNILYGLLTIAFCFFYTAIIFNPQEISENLKKHGAFIPGIRPGKHTTAYLDYVLNRVTFAGSIFLASVALIPQFGSIAFGLPFSISGFLGGTGMLIVVGVGLDLIQQIESHLHMHNYEGFTKKRIRGRRG